MKLLREGLERIPVFSLVSHIVKGTRSSKTLPMLSNELVEGERIKVTDDIGNTGYLSSDERKLIQGSGSLEQLMTFLLEELTNNPQSVLSNALKGLESALNTMLEVFQEIAASQSPEEAMRVIKEHLETFF